MAHSNTVETTQRSTCTACGGSSLHEVISLPNLPLTGIFVPPAERELFPTFDQALLYCGFCGHGQLREVVDPTYLYQDTYTHRSSLSPISTRGNDFFLEFLTEVVGPRTFDYTVEIGCNDLYLLRRLQGRSRSLAGFDPIWKGQQPDLATGISVSGKYIEEIVPATDFEARPDLVLSVHTLEHVRDPLASLRPIFDYAAPGAIFAIELPSLDTLIDTNRFDQLFHQHLNYFSLSSIHRLIESIGGEFLAHRYNHGYWLGTMLVAFRKPDTVAVATTREGSQRVRPGSEVTEAFEGYRQGMRAFAASLARLKGTGATLLGFGAAQMVPTLAYHLEDDLSQLDVILDDNPDKAGLSYPGLSPQIALVSSRTDISQCGVLVTALDSARPIINNLLTLRPRYILHPGNPF